MDIRLAGIIDDSIVDGPGMRAVLFTQGCPHRCEGCHNPHTFDFEGGGIHRTEDITARILSNPLLSGVTFSGGEPLCQPVPLTKIAESVKKAGLSVLIYTGYEFEYLLKENDPARLKLLSLTDILIDGKFILALRDLTLRFRGSRNQRILDCPASLKAGKAAEYIFSD